MSVNSAEWKSTACILCECNCGIEVQLGGEDGRHLVRVRGDDAHPLSRGYACEKPARLDYYQNGPQRLTKPLRRRADGRFEEIDWETAIREVAQRFAAVRDAHGGDSIFYYGGGGQGNHLPGSYGRATRSVLGSRYRSNAIAQEKTGEFWVTERMLGGFSRADFEHCEVALFPGKNPWMSNSLTRTRVTLREIARDPARCLIVIDPRITETAEMADIHLRVKPGCDAWLLSAMVATVVQEDLLATDFLAAHADGLEAVLAHFERLDIAAYCRNSGIAEEQVRTAARRIAVAKSVASFEDLGVQMNHHSTLVSYLHRLLILLTGQFGKKGAAYCANPLVTMHAGRDGGSGGRHLSPVTGSRIIGGLVPCNVIAEEILTDHPKRFRAMLVDAANPAYSVADSQRMREALSALELLVVVDIAMSETARLADYVLPVASQFEKAEASFFYFDFPENCFHLRRPLLEPLPGLFSEAELHARLVEALGAMPQDAVAALRTAWKAGRPQFRAKFAELTAAEPRLRAIAPVVLYRAIGDLLPKGLAEAAAIWELCQMAAPRLGASLTRAGFAGPPAEAADSLFDAILSAKSGVVYSVDDDWQESFARIKTGNGRIQLAIPELFDELDGLASELPPQPSAAYPFVLSAGERRAYTANTIIRNPAWRRKDTSGALAIHPDDARNLGLADGDRVRISTPSGSAEVALAYSERMMPGHISLPDGLGLDYPDEQGQPRVVGVATNELTGTANRDWVAGTPWHKYVPAHLAAL